MRDEQQKLAREMAQLRQRLGTSERHAAQLQEEGNRLMQDLARMQKRHTTLLQFCQARLQQQAAAVDGLADLNREGTMGSAPPLAYGQSLGARQEPQ